MQMNSDMSNTTMKVSVLTLYPLQTIVMNCIEIMQDMMCRHGHTMLVFLSVEFMDIINGTYVEKHVTAARKVEERTKCDCKGAETSMKKAVRGIQCTTKEQKL